VRRAEQALQPHHWTKIEIARRKLEEGFQALYEIDDVQEILSADHVEKTPKRSAEAIFALFAGIWQDPVNMLQAQFSNKKYDQLLWENDIGFVSVCAHHTLPFFGKAHFGYLPNASIVGLSKIPRLVECYARRPTYQEQMTDAIVDTFTEVVKPYGCGIVVEAWHSCVGIRGVNQRSAYTRTCALRGSFKLDPTRTEFLNGIHKATEQLWP
jgi:GTP cyclohydrolase IA